MKDKRLFDQYVEHFDKTIEFESMMNDVIERFHEEIKKLKEKNNFLQRENAEQKAKIERLTEKVENQKSVIKGQDNRIKKEKAENQRLYDEYVRLDDFCAVKGCICCICENKKTCNECKSCGSLKTEKCNGFKIDVSKYARAIERADKLQKQVDELKAKQVIECYGMLKGCDIVNQAVKDTAKEILDELDLYFKGTTFRKGYEFNKIEKKLKEIAERKGVEVE